MCASSATARLPADCALQQRALLDMWSELSSGDLPPEDVLQRAESLCELLHSGDLCTERHWLGTHAAAPAVGGDRLNCRAALSAGLLAVDALCRAPAGGDRPLAADDVTRKLVDACKARACASDAAGAWSLLCEHDEMALATLAVLTDFWRGAKALSHAPDGVVHAVKSWLPAPRLWHHLMCDIGLSADVLLDYLAGEPMAPVALARLARAMAGDWRTFQSAYDAVRPAASAQSAYVRPPCGDPAGPSMQLRVVERLTGDRERAFSLTLCGGTTERRARTPPPTWHAGHTAVDVRRVLAVDFAAAVRRLDGRHLLPYDARHLLRALAMLPVQ